MAHRLKKLATSLAMTFAFASSGYAAADDIPAQPPAPIVTSATAAPASVDMLNNTMRSPNGAAAIGLIDRVPDLNAYDAEGFTPLMQAVRSKNKPAVLKLLSKGVDPDLRKANTGNTALIQAIVGGSTDIARILVNYSRNLDIQNDQGQTALMKAVISAKSAEARDDKSGIEDITRHLLAKGANVDIKTPAGYTALTYALLGDNAVLAGLLVDANANLTLTENKLNQTPLHIAAGIPSMEDVAIRMLVKGASMEARTLQGMTPLMMATQAGNTNLVRELLDRGANALAKDLSGSMASSYADKSATKIKDLLQKAEMAQNMRNKISLKLNR